MKIKVINGSKNQLPEYSTANLTGMNLLTFVDSKGMIDFYYRREVCIKFVNLSGENFPIEYGERIYQLLVAIQGKAEWESVETLLDSESRSEWFGHTGKN